MNKLIEKALRATDTTRTVPATKEEAELAVAYLRGEITIRQYAKAFDRSDAGFASHRISAVLRQAVQNGWLSIKLKK